MLDKVPAVCKRLDCCKSRLVSCLAPWLVPYTSQTPIVDLLCSSPRKHFEGAGQRRFNGQPSSTRLKNVLCA
jgi:hypothetical protein